MTRTLVLSFLIFLVPLASCRIKAPSLQEQQAMVSRGMFADGAPPWMARAAIPSGVALESSGLIPESFSRQKQYIDENGPVAALSAERERKMLQGQVKEREATATDKLHQQDVTEKSPLGRILRSCPTVEDDVKSALVTVDSGERISKYENLTRRCSESADLWMWLGKDYMKAGKLAAGRRAFERAAIIDPTNDEAKQLLADAEDQLNGVKNAQ